MEEGEEVASGLLVACGNAAELLDLVPEALGQVALLVRVPVVLAQLLAAAQRWDHRLGAGRLHPADEAVAVVRLVGDHRLGRKPLQQGLRLGQVAYLPGGHPQPYRVAQAVHRYVGRGRGAAEAPPQRLLRLPARAVAFFFAPAECWWARMMVESRMSHSRSGSCSTAKTARQTPFLAQRSKRRQALFQLPKRSGRS